MGRPRLHPRKPEPADPQVVVRVWGAGQRWRGQVVAVDRGGKWVPVQGPKVRSEYMATVVKKATHAWWQRQGRVCMQCGTKWKPASSGQVAAWCPTCRPWAPPRPPAPPKVYKVRWVRGQPRAVAVAADALELLEDAEPLPLAWPGQPTGEGE